MTGPQPIRWALLAFMVSALISYAAGSLRGLTTMELNSADRTMLLFCVFAGVLLAAADGLPNWLRLRGVLETLVYCASVVALIGLVQYVFVIDVTQYMIFPGLEPKGWTIGFEARGGGTGSPARPRTTSSWRRSSRSRCRSPCIWRTTAAAASTGSWRWSAW